MAAGSQVIVQPTTGRSSMAQQTSNFPSQNAAPSSIAAPPPTRRKAGIEAPTMKLTGHSGEVLAVHFSPDGKSIASAGADHEVLIYNVYGEVATFCTLRGHSRAILDFRWSIDGSQLYTASADQTAAVWDVERGERVKKLKGHAGIVNACSTASKTAAESPSRKTFGCSSMLVTGGDDGATRVWDVRLKRSVKKYQHQYQILSVALDGHGGRVFAGSLDNSIRVYDLRHGGEEEAEVFSGHVDSVTGLCLNESSTMLFSNSMDMTVRVWDIQPFVSGGNREIALLRGATHNFEKNLLRVACSRDEKLCSAGSADRQVCIWNIQDAILQQKKHVPGPMPLLYRLPGHTGSVNDVCFHPEEPIIASASSDRTVIMGELA